ncbi:MAG: [Fe-Fe] hydrogenase large subunit C-terminal domain-containing protein [Candidatus Gottesmanbacteria bacterium]
MEQSYEVKELLGLLKTKEPLVAMLAPSFPIMFAYPQIIGKLKRLGFKYVVEVAVGAQETNRQLLELLKKEPRSRYITSPCSSIIRLIRSKYPELVKFIAPVDSPIIATAKLVSQKYPKFRPVFIGPCFVKKLEAREYPRLNILVITFSELLHVFAATKIGDRVNDIRGKLDLQGKNTRLYPISGGLAESSEFNRLLTDEEYDVISGPKNVEKSLPEFPQNRLRVLDILYCQGGCINGVGINSTLSIQERRQKIIDHWQMA